jgi:hypothetical protein
LYGPSAIALAVTAFECSLNEILHTCLRTTPPGQQLEEYRSLTRHDNLLAKFKTIPALVTGRPALENPDLELAQQVRHEIVHYYPRHIGTPSGVPEWLQPLVDKNLLCNSGAASGDICWEAKLQSFQLARWCGAAVANAAEQFETALNAEGRQMTGASFKAAGIASKFCKLVI